MTRTSNSETPRRAGRASPLRRFHNAAPPSVLIPLDLDALRSALAPPEPHPAPLPPRASGVLVPLVGERDLALLYTKRADHLTSHAGEVSFPGGRIEAGETALEAALRETEEEVGVAARDIDVLGHLTDFMTYRGVLVCAYVGLVRGPVGATNEEVAEAFAVPVDELARPDVWEGRSFAEPGPRPRGPPDARVVHYFHVKPHLVWGITGELTAQFLAKAVGWTMPRPPKIIRRLEDYLP